MLRAEQRSNESLVGLCCGMLAFPASWFGWLDAYPSSVGPSAIVLPMILLSAGAGMIGGILQHGYPNSGSNILGIRSALVATIVAGALTVLAASLRAFGLGSTVIANARYIVIAVMLPASRPAQVLVVTLLGIPPSLFFGVLGALVPPFFRALVISRPEGYALPEGKKKKLRGPMLISVAVLAAVGYLSPFAAFIHSRRPLSPVRFESPHVSPPPPPAIWRYVKPAGFDSLEANQLAVANQLELGRIEPTLPFAMSSDGSLFASCRREGMIAVLIWDLETAELRGEFRLPGVASIAWSPNSRRLLCVSRDEPRQLFVLDADSSRMLPLPQPKNVRVPDGRPNWWHDEEVLFVTGHDSRVLDLDTLRVTPAETSARWNGLLSDQKKGYLAPTAALAPSAKWEFGVTPTVLAYEVPLDNRPWPVGEAFRLCVSSPGAAFQKCLSDVEIVHGDGLTVARDGTKAVRIHNGLATAFYLGEAADSPLRFSVTMPAPPPDSISDSLSKRSVCAFVCAPLVNPLNGKTVGPDRGQVKAIARVERWDGNVAELWVDRSYSPLRKGDVVADLHEWAGGRARSIGGLDEWFSVISQFVSSKDAPPRAEAADLALGAVSSRFRGNKVEIFDRAAPPRPAIKEEVGPLPVQRGTVSSMPQSKGVNAMLEGFLRSHHAKSSQSDIDGLVADYDERVDYFQEGVVDRATIRKGELEYHSPPGTQVTERLTTQPEFSEVDPHYVRARYSISYERTRPDGRWVRGESDIEMEIELTPAGPRIAKQRGENRNQQKGP